MKNRMRDLNNTLFEQLERLNDAELDAEGIGREAKRASAIVDVADRIIDNHATVIRVFESAAKAGVRIEQPALLEFLQEPERLPSNGK